MTIKSLQDLNTYAQSPITYNDVREAQVLFDRGATVDQSLTTQENYTFEFPWGINIEDITQYDVAQMEYEIDLSNFTTPVSITWSFLPAHVTVSRVNNIWTISDIRSASDWEYVKRAQVQPPFGFSGLIAHTGTLSWYADSLATTRTTATWDVNLTVTAVDYWSGATPLTYTANETKINMTTPTIIVSTDDFAPEWTLRISAALNSDKIVEMFSDGSPAEAYWDDVQKEFVVIGDTDSVNTILASLDVEFGRSDVDLYMFYSLANNFTSNIEVQVQTIESRDFISDNAMTATANIAPNAIRGAEFDHTANATINSVPAVTREVPVSLISSSNFYCDADRLIENDIELAAAFNWHFPYYWWEPTGVFSIQDGSYSFYTSSNVVAETGSLAVSGDYLWAVNGADEYGKVYNLVNRTVDHIIFNPNPDGVVNDEFGRMKTAMSNNRAIVGARWESDTASFSGFAYIFNTSTGATIASLDNPNNYSTGDNDSFGFSVDISNSYAVVGAPLEDSSNGSNSGAAYVYSSTGTLAYTLLSPNPASSDYFGWDVSITDDWVAVGEPNYNDNGLYEGRVHVYSSSNGSFVRTISNPNPKKYFGSQVEISGDYLLIWTPDYEIAVYDINTGTEVWSQPVKEGTQNSVNFDRPLAISDSYVAAAGANVFDKDGDGTFESDLVIFDITNGEVVYNINSQADLGASVNLYPYVGLTDDYAVVYGSPISSSAIIIDI